MLETIKTMNEKNTFVLNIDKDRIFLDIIFRIVLLKKIYTYLVFDIMMVDPFARGSLSPNIMKRY